MPSPCSSRPYYLQLTSRSAAQEAETQLLAALNSTELVSQDMGIYLARYVTLIENVELS